MQRFQHYLAFVLSVASCALIFRQGAKAGPKAPAKPDPPFGRLEAKTSSHGRFHDSAPPLSFPDDFAPCGFAVEFVLDSHHVPASFRVAIISGRGPGLVSLRPSESSGMPSASEVDGPASVATASAVDCLSAGVSPENPFSVPVVGRDSGGGASFLRRGQAHATTTATPNSARVTNFIIRVQNSGSSIR